MISNTALPLMAMACKLFIIELTFRGWFFTYTESRTILQKCDILNAISKADVFDFLLEIITNEEREESNKSKLSNLVSFIRSKVIIFLCLKLFLFILA